MLRPPLSKEEHVDPKHIPDFYGYGSDIEVGLPSGKMRARHPMPKVRLRDVLAMILLAPPLLVFEIAKVLCGHDRYSHIECDIKFTEKR